jgi:hypothetical protein
MTLRIFVKRGALWRFNRLKRDSKELPVSVEWDRRTGERRTTASGHDSGDKRTTDRRGEPPCTWETGEFVVVEEPEEQRADAEPLP